jgi:uncharacterized membrane protein
MLGLVIRVLVLCTVVFAIVYGVTRALRENAHSKHAQRIADEIKKLRESIAAGQMSPSEYADIAERIRSDCKRLGIAVPDLPPHIPPRAAKED